MGSGASQRVRTASRTTLSKHKSASLCEQQQLREIPRVGFLAPMPKPVCAECGLVDHTAQYRSLEQRRLCAACWRASDSLTHISEKKYQGTPTSHASTPSKGGNKYSGARWSPLPLVANVTRQPTSSMGPIAKSLLRGSGPVVLDSGACSMRRRCLSDPCLKALAESDDCSTHVPSDASSSSSDCGSDASSRSNSSSSITGRSTGSSETWEVQRSLAERRSLPNTNSHRGLQSSVRAVRREESRQLCERRPKSNMLRRRYVHCCT